MDGMGSDTAKITTRPQRMMAVGVLMLVMLTSYTYVIPVFAIRICQLFSLSVEEYGTMIGLGSLSQIASLLLVGLMITRFGGRRISEFSLVGIGSCFALIGFGSNLSSLKVSLAVNGFFSGLVKVAIPGFLISLYPTLKRRIISVQLVTVAIAGIVIPLWANQLLQWSEGDDYSEFSRVFFGPFLIIGCMVIIGGVLLSLGRQLSVEDPQITSAKTFLRELFERRSLTIVLLVALHTSADGTIFQFLPMFMQHHFDELPLAPAWALSGHAIAYVITRVILSLLPEGFGQRAILTLAGPIGGFLILVMLWQGHAFSVPFLYTLASLFYAAEFPVLVSEISSRSIGHFGTILASGLLVSNAATFLFLKGTGRLIDTTSDYRVALSVAACGFIVFGVMATVTRLGKVSVTRSPGSP